jgi:hypothetical protein
MLDGLVIQTTKEYAYPLQPVYTKIERALDVERIVHYYPNCEIHSIVKYFDPRRDKEHKSPLRIRVHKIMTQFENFLFSQLPLEDIASNEMTLLTNTLEMNPEQVYFDLIVGWFHTQGWQVVFKPFGEMKFADDMIFVRKKVKLAKYHMQGVDFKFYRMNPEENREHALKYPFGWMGLTKCEMPTPILLLSNEKDCNILQQALAELQRIRENIVKDKWEQMQFEVGAKTFARSDSLYAWSGNDQNLRGTLKIEETELTKRERMPVTTYFDVVKQFIASNKG